MLNVSQSNALVYSALSAFFLVGMFAGWKVRSKKDFLSGIRTQSGECARDRANFGCHDSPHLTFPFHHSVPSHPQLDRIELVRITTKPSWADRPTHLHRMNSMHYSGNSLLHNSVRYFLRFSTRRRYTLFLHSSCIPSCPRHLPSGGSQIR